MRIIEYSDPEVGDLRAAYEKTVAQPEREDFACAGKARHERLHAARAGDAADPLAWSCRQWW